MKMVLDIFWSYSLLQSSNPGISQLYSSDEHHKQEATNRFVSAIFGAGLPLLREPYSVLILLPQKWYNYPWGSENIQSSVS